MWSGKDGNAEVGVSRMRSFVIDVCRYILFFFSSRRRHTRFDCDWSSDVCSSDLTTTKTGGTGAYRFENLPVGTYKITVKSSGFKSAVQQVDVVLNQTGTLNVTLTQIGRASCRERV